MLESFPGGDLVRELPAALQARGVPVAACGAGVGRLTLEAGMARARVLVADDSPTSLAVVSDLLARDGHEVMLARDGLEAMELALRELPDIVVLDVVMPRMNGYQVCRMLKLDEQTGHIPVVMLTSRDQPADHYWGLQTGADMYVTKEQPLEAVSGAVSTLLHRRERAGVERPLAGPMKPPGAVELLSRLNDILDRKLYEATVLGEVSKLAWSAADVERTAREIMALFGKLFDFSLACMLVHGDGSRPTELLWMVRSCLSAATLSSCERQVLGSCARSGHTPVHGQQVRRRAVTAPNVRVTQNEGASLACGDCHIVPLGGHGQESGLFALWCSDRCAVSPESRQTIEMLANAAFAVLDNARLYEELRRLATTDGLTGLANYRQFQESLEREFQRSRRSGEPMAVLMLDLDDFKAINDAFGHKRGDQVLQTVSAAIARSARQYDLVARYGGEEFAVILPGTGAKGALEMAERLRSLVRTVARRMNMERLSVSVGIAVYPCGGIRDADGLVHEADAALYRAKAEGKDRVWLNAEG